MIIVFSGDELREGCPRCTLLGRVKVAGGGVAPFLTSPELCHVLKPPSAPGLILHRPPQSVPLFCCIAVNLLCTCVPTEP